MIGKGKILLWIKNFKKGVSKDEIDVTPKKEEVTDGENVS